MIHDQIEIVTPKHIIVNKLLDKKSYQWSLEYTDCRKKMTVSIQISLQLGDSLSLLQSQKCGYWKLGDDGQSINLEESFYHLD